MIGFLINFSLNAYRLNISIAIVAMVTNNPNLHEQKRTSNSCQIYLLNTTNELTFTENKSSLELGEVDWSPKIQGYVLGSYFVSYVILQIPAGRFVERYGCKWFMIGAVMLSAVGTLMLPIASKFHAYAAIAMQVARGIGHAFFHPATLILAANWFPKLERGPLYTFMLSGGCLGACLGSIFAGLLCKSELLGGWPSSFYAFGIAGVVLAIGIACFTYESPSVHPYISESELKYITANQENALTKRRPRVPWNKIIRSGPFYGMVLGFVGPFWALSQFLNVHSTFLGTILHYPIKENGYFSAFPFLIMFFCAQFSSWLSLIIIRRKYASINQTRKFWNLLATLGLSACSLGLCLVGCARSWSVVLSMLSMGFFGLGYSGVSVVPTEMSPTFAASLKAICNTFGCLPLFIVPVVVGSLTNEMQTIEQWNKVFFLSIGVILTSGIIFQVIGSAELQPWNEVKYSSKQDQDRSTKF